jgi:hypothetical protein
MKMLVFDSESEYNHYYKKEAFHPYLNKALEIFVETSENHDSRTVELSSVCGVVKTLDMKEKDNGEFEIYADLHLLKTPKGLAIRNVIESENENNLFLHMVGIGVVGDNKLIENYNLIKFTLWLL